MKDFLSKIVTHFKYPSSWQGLVILASAAGVSVSPELAAQISGVGVSVFGLIGFLWSDSDVKPK